jgi:hypothetical protein
LLGEVPADLGLVQRLAFAQSHGHVPRGALTDIGSLVVTLLARCPHSILQLCSHLKMGRPDAYIDRRLLLLGV